MLYFKIIRLFGIRSLNPVLQWIVPENKIIESIFLFAL